MTEAIVRAIDEKWTKTNKLYYILHLESVEKGIEKLAWFQDLGNIRFGAKVEYTTKRAGQYVNIDKMEVLAKAEPGQEQRRLPALTSSTLGEDVVVTQEIYNNLCMRVEALEKKVYD